MPKFGILIPILRSCGVHYRNISGIYLKQPPGLHHAKPPCVSIWNIYFILMDVILISMYHCWAVLTFLWELGWFRFLHHVTRTWSVLIFFFSLVRTDQVIKILKFSTFTRFSNRVILAYITIDGFQIQFSPIGSYIFQTLNFNLTINQNLKN